MVATGDSYSSGEGIGGQGACSQSSQAYGPLSHVILGPTAGKLAFTACSGHLIEDLFNARPLSAAAVGGKQPKDSMWTWGSKLLGTDKVDVITLTFGGNDVGFPEIILDCLPAVPDSWGEAAAGASAGRAGGLLGSAAGVVVQDIDGCDITEDELLQRVDALFKPTATPAHRCKEGRHESRRSGPPDYSCSLLIVEGSNGMPQVRGGLSEFYEYLVREHLSERGNLFVVGYPQLFAPFREWLRLFKTACAGIAGDDIPRLNAAANRLNLVIDTAVRRANLRLGVERIHFLDVTPSYRGGKHELCGSGEDWINLAWNAPAPKKWQGAFHPNARGYSETADLVMKAMLQADWTTRRPSEPSTVSAATELVIDTSGSMADEAGDGLGTKLDAAKRAAEALLTILQARSVDRGADVVGVVEFSSTAAIVAQPSSDLDAVRASVQTLVPTDGTNIGAGLAAGIDALSQASGAKSVVLLSDGQSNEGLSADRILSDLVPAAANAGIKIYTVGFGTPESLDEQLLKDIAQGTGGAYGFASTPMGLQQSFMEAQAASDGVVRNSLLSAVAQGQVAPAGVVTVPAEVGELQVALSWPGSDLDVELRDPTGTLVDDAYPGARILRTNPEVVHVAEPVAGDWQLDVKGVDVPGAAEEFVVVASTRGIAPPALPPRPEPTDSPTPTVIPAAPESKRRSSTPGLLVILSLLALTGGGGALALTLSRRAVRRCGNCGGRAGVGPTCPSCGGPVTGCMDLRVVGGPEHGRLLRIRPGDVVGRGEDAHHQLAELSVSRRHAHIGWHETSWYVEDLGSASGTFRNGERVVRARLSHGDLLSLGQTSLVVEQAEPAGPWGPA